MIYDISVCGFSCFLQFSSDCSKSRLPAAVREWSPRSSPEGRPDTRERRKSSLRICQRGKLNFKTSTSKLRHLEMTSSCCRLTSASLCLQAYRDRKKLFVRISKMKTIYIAKLFFYLYISIFTIDLLTPKTSFVFEFINKHCSLFNLFFSYATGRRSYINFKDL